MKFAGFSAVCCWNREVCEAGTEESGSGRWVWSENGFFFFENGFSSKKLLGRKNPCPPPEVLGREQDPQGSFVLCSAFASSVLYTGFAHVGGRAQLLLSERLMGEQRSKNKMWMLPWLLSRLGSPRGRGLAARDWKAPTDRNISPQSVLCGLCFLMQMFVSSASTQNCTLT